jgi:hypothetical protein
MSNSKTENDRPLWQKISGIDPASEDKLDSNARDAAIRKLVLEVERRATVEFERADSGLIPAEERTVFWDPLARVCLQLGISRTKLSLYTRELTGMRAHEISDRILARRTLKAKVTANVEALLLPELARMMKEVRPPKNAPEIYKVDTASRFVKWMRSLRAKERRVRFAATMGFANPSRLSRACLLGLGMSIDELEARAVCTLVQKFFEELDGEGLAQSREDAKKEQQRKESVLTEEGRKIIDEAVRAVVGGVPQRVKVA